MVEAPCCSTHQSSTAGGRHTSLRPRARTSSMVLATFSRLLALSAAPRFFTMPAMLLLMTWHSGGARAGADGQVRRCCTALVMPAMRLLMTWCMVQGSWAWDVGLSGAWV